jgi:hypothetical protein
MFSFLEKSDLLDFKNLAGLKVIMIRHLESFNKKAPSNLLRAFLKLSPTNLLYYLIINVTIG